MNRFNQLSDAQAKVRSDQVLGPDRPRIMPAGRRPLERGRAAVWQARLALLVMINIAQLWILSATVEAALAGQYRHLLPLVIASGVCWLIAGTIFLWWKPVSSRRSSTGYVKENETTHHRI
jgi:hypothetical protein